jgi:alpha-L-fucosidase
MSRIFRAKTQRSAKYIQGRCAVAPLREIKPKHYLLSVILLSILSLSSLGQQKKTNFVSETRAQKEQRMKWWEDARFGLFIHWGLYSVPAGEWKGDTTHAEWIRTTAQIPLKEYERFVQAI